MRKPAAWPPSPTPDRVAWEEKSSSHLLSCWVSGWGGAEGHQEDLLSWGGPLAPAERKDTRLSCPVAASGTLEPLPTKEFWFPRSQGPSKQASSCGLWTCPDPKGPQATRS